MFLNVEKDETEITAEILQNLPAKYQKSVGFFSWDYARAIAIGGFEKIYTILKYVCALGDINNFEYDDLVKFVFQRRGIVARTPQKAFGSVILTGNGEIKKGDLFQTESGTQFESLENKTIVESGVVAVQAVLAGENGNVPASSITIIPISITGIATVNNLSAMSGGYNKESKESIIERYLDDIQKPITSNNIYHYEKWAKEVTGVGNVKIKPLWNGDNTVKVVIVNSANEIADNLLINTVQKYIDPYSYEVTDGTDVGFVQNYVTGNVPVGEIVYADMALTKILGIAQANEFSYVSSAKKGWGYGNGVANIGAYVTVSSATAKNINITVNITLKAGVVLEEVKTEIQNKINEYLKSTVFKDSYISFAKIGASVLSADGVLDYSNLKVNNSTNNIVLVDTNQSVEIAILQSLTINEA